MIRMIQSISASHAKGYFNDSLSAADYYLNGQEGPGQFGGKVADRLGVAGAASKTLFDAFCENINPLTNPLAGQSLTQRNVPNRTVGYDINFHCPKSVSVLHALTDDPHIQAAFTASVAETMQVIEADVQTRVRKQGRDEDRLTGELLYAQFLHQTARPVMGQVPDPHLHSHCFVFNVTWDAVEQTFKAGQFRQIKRDMPYYQAWFHKVLSDRLMGLGYEIRRTKTAFELVGVPQNVIDLFSKRTDEIGRVAQAQGMNSPQQLDALGARTRAPKQTALTLPELKTAWREQVLALCIKDEAINGPDVADSAPTLSVAPILPIAPNPPSQAIFQNTIQPTPQACVNHALLMRFERASVIQDRRILETAYRYAIGYGSATVEQITAAFMADKRILPVTENGKTLCTTKAVLAEEQRMVRLARQGKGALKPLYPIAPSIALTGEQAAAVAHILTTPDRVSIVKGKAGTGKTTLLHEAMRLSLQAGCPMTVVAPTAHAARGVLRDEGFADADTVAALLASPQLQANLPNGLLWVDEAGLLNNADMTALLQLATQTNARLVLAGDTRQHSSVLRGDALRLLNNVGGIQAAEVSQIYRQRAADYRRAVQALADGDIKTGFALLDQMNAIKVMSNITGPLNLYAQLVDDYVAIRLRGKTALVIAPTHHEGAQVTEAIRDKLRSLGQIGQTDTPIPQLVNTDLTLAEKQDSRNYTPGQIIQFNKACQGIRRGSRWRVVEVGHRGVMIQNAAGVVRPLPLPSNVPENPPENVPEHISDNAPFDVFQPTMLGLAQGDAIRITRNGQDASQKRLTNGQLLTVASVNSDGTVMAYNTISKARYQLPPDYGHVAHAHCLTSYAAQGKTVDAVLIAQSSASFAATNRNQFYVSVSRAREQVCIYTDDKDALFEQAAQSGDRLAAVELVKRKTLETYRAEHLLRTQWRTRQHSQGVQPATTHRAAKLEPIAAMPHKLQQKRPEHKGSKQQRLAHAPRP